MAVALAITVQLTSSFLMAHPMDGDAMKNGWAVTDLQTHSLLSKLVWAYLIGHAGMALLHHLLRRRSLRVMWRLDAADAAPRELTKM